MKQRGGSIITPTAVFYIVAFIAVFNVIAFMHLGDWSAVGVFVLAGVVTFSVTSQKTIALGAAVVAASLFRTTNILHLEGMETKEKEKETKEPEKESAKQTATNIEKLKEAPTEEKPKYPWTKKEPEGHEKPSAAKTVDAFSLIGTEGMTEQIGMLQKHQVAMTESMKALQPLMMQASKLLRSVDPKILDGAFKSLGKNGALNL